MKRLQDRQTPDATTIATGRLVEPDHALDTRVDNLTHRCVIARYDEEVKSA